jgi:hypothetical protein
MLARFSASPRGFGKYSNSKRSAGASGASSSAGDGTSTSANAGDTKAPDDHQGSSAGTGSNSSKIDPKQFRQGSGRGSGSGSGSGSGGTDWKAKFTGGSGGEPPDEAKFAQALATAALIYFAFSGTTSSKGKCCP